MPIRCTAPHDLRHAGEFAPAVALRHPVGNGRMEQGFRPALAGSGPGLLRNRRAKERGAIREPPLRNGMDGTLRERTLRPVSRVGLRRRAEERPVSCAGCAVLCAKGMTDAKMPVAAMTVLRHGLLLVRKRTVLEEHNRCAACGKSETLHYRERRIRCRHFGAGHAVSRIFGKNSLRFQRSIAILVCKNPMISSQSRMLRNSLVLPGIRGVPSPGGKAFRRSALPFPPDMTKNLHRNSRTAVEAAWMERSSSPPCRAAWGASSGANGRWWPLFLWRWGAPVLLTSRAGICVYSELSVQFFF